MKKEKNEDSDSFSTKEDNSSDEDFKITTQKRTKKKLRTKTKRIKGERSSKNVIKKTKVRYFNYKL